MKKFLPTTFVIASCTLGLGLAAGSLATASYAPEEAFEIDVGVLNHATEDAHLPMPVIGDDLFFAQNSGASCMSFDQVVGIFATDQAEYGGRTVKVIDGKQQAFANSWRDQTGLERMDVSNVVGHMFLDEGNKEWTVDVVEFDAAGCAVSRTLLTDSVWNDLLDNPTKV